jgi:8-oxo-dGTP diphosphatase
MIEVTCAIIVENGRVLATRRSERMPHPLKWEFPGGKLKDGESPERCIVREIREELGVEVEVRQVLRPVTHHYQEQSIKLIPIICQIFEGIISLTEHMEYRWLAPAKLDDVDWLEADVEVASMARKALEA